MSKKGRNTISLGESIKIKRIQNGLTQEELAKRLGVQQSYVSQWELEKMDPTDEDLNKIEVIFFGERLWKKRNQIGLTQEELAKRLGVQQSYVSQWELGKTEPPKETLNKIEKIFGKIKRPRKQKISDNSDNYDINKSSSEEEETDDENISPFSVWLNRTRLNNNLSIPELATKANIAAQTIYAIENGKIINPRDITREKLEKALGEKTSDEISKEVEKDAQISSDMGELVDFNPHDSEDVPEEPGVYVLYDISERPIYVGQGKSIKTRIKEHDVKFWFKRPIVQTGAYVVVKDQKQRKGIESLLIKFLKNNAVINKKEVDR